MNRRLAPLALAVLGALGACSASSPPIRLHTLMPAELARPDATTPRTGPLAVVLEPIVIPSQVDQPQWLVRLPDESVAVLEQERWASPLRDELRGALLEQLTARHGAVEGRGGDAAGAPQRLGLTLRRFDSIPGREARLEGFWTVTGTAGTPVLRCELLLREAAGEGMTGLAAAHRRAVVRLADAMAAGLRSRQAGQAACPAIDPR